jgi:hypothetical protein
VRPDGEHVAQHRLAVGQVPLLAAAIEADLPIAGHGDLR